MSENRPSPEPVILPGSPMWSAASAKPDNEVRYRGEAGTFFWILSRGALLQLVTLGFYRFWLATDIRRYLWSHTSVDGHAFEYTGRGRELLIGFLFALAILSPIYLGYFLLSIEAERMRAFASFPMFLFLVLFGQFAIFRARRYRMTRTIFRGVRFWMTGSGWNYAWRSFLWLMFVFATLGLAYPWRAAAIERFKMRHTFYGDLQGGFDARAWDFFKSGVLLWFICIMPLVCLLIPLGLMAWGFWGPDPRLAAVSVFIGPMLVIVMTIVSLVIIAAIWPFFRALEWRWWASGIHFGGLRLTCNLSGWSMLALYLKMFALASVVASIVGIGLAVAGVGLGAAAGIKFNMSAAGFGRLNEANQIAVAAWLGFSYIATLLAVGVVQRFFLQGELWRIVSESMIVHNLAATENVAARGEAVNALGEGFADSLDISGF